MMHRIIIQFEETDPRMIKITRQREFKVLNTESDELVGSSHDTHAYKFFEVAVRSLNITRRVLRVVHRAGLSKS